MDDTKKVFQTKLISNLISSWCKEKCDENKIIFDQTLVSSNFVRFYTKTLGPLFECDNKKGYWNNGLSMLYEITFDEKGLVVTLQSSGMLVKNRQKYNSFLKSNGLQNEDNNVSKIKEWLLIDDVSFVESIVNSLETFLSDLYRYEKELEKWNQDNDYSIYNNYFLEGKQYTIESSVYERNPEARKKCIEANGAYCHICGFDFGVKYGAKYANVIEVHHIIPLSTIRKEYIVDPVNDLIPVCSNCHTILHSETPALMPEDLKKILNK